MDDFDDTEDIEEPIGAFILQQPDIKGIQTPTGTYYHYSEVCQLLRRLKQSLT